MYWLNKIFWIMLNPAMVGLILVILTGFFILFRKRRLSFALLCTVGLWFWAWSTNELFKPLARKQLQSFPPMRVENVPKADAIVLLGGGIGATTNRYFYSELYPAADRTIHAARLWKVGRAPLIVAAGTGVPGGEVCLLRELGVPQEAILIEDRSRNTEENATYTATLLEDHWRSQPSSLSTVKPRVLLVTSLSHMRRSLLMFRKYAQGLDVFPVATDFENAGAPYFLGGLWPTPENFGINSNWLHELVGYWWYRIVRK